MSPKNPVFFLAVALIAAAPSTSAATRCGAVGQPAAICNFSIIDVICAPARLQRFTDSSPFSRRTLAASPRARSMLRGPPSRAALQRRAFLRRLVGRPARRCRQRPGTLPTTNFWPSGRRGSAGKRLLSLSLLRDHDTIKNFFVGVEKPQTVSSNGPSSVEEGMPSSQLPSWTRAGVHHCATHCRLHGTPCAAASATCRVPARRRCTDMRSARSTSAGWVCRQCSDDSSGTVVSPPWLAALLVTGIQSASREVARSSSFIWLSQAQAARAAAGNRAAPTQPAQQEAAAQPAPAQLAANGTAASAAANGATATQAAAAPQGNGLAPADAGQVCAPQSRHQPKICQTHRCHCTISPLQGYVQLRLLAPVYRSCFQHLYREVQAQNPKWKKLAAALLRANGGVMKTTKLQRSLLKSANCSVKSKASLKADMLSKVGLALTECSSAIMVCLE